MNAYPIGGALFICLFIYLFFVVVWGGGGGGELNRIIARFYQSSIWSIYSLLTNFLVENKITAMGRLMLAESVAFRTFRNQDILKLSFQTRILASD